MIILNRYGNNTNLDTPTDCVFGFVIDGAVCFVSGDDKYLTIVRGEGDIQVCDISGCIDIGEIIEKTNLCNPNDVVRVLYSHNDFAISVDV
jgi:hypothetical protein